MNTHHVYSICNGGNGLYLSIEFSGSKKECNDFVKSRVRKGLPTHFMNISSLDFEKASIKFL